jgi:hypothetical protein
MLIDGYMKESEVEGVQPAQAWAQLFAAAVLLMVPLLECRSDHHNQEMDDTLGELGIILAWDRRHQ